MFNALSSKVEKIFEKFEYHTKLAENAVDCENG